MLSEEDSEFYLEKLKTKVKSGRALVEVRKGTAKEGNTKVLS